MINKFLLMIVLCAGMISGVAAINVSAQGSDKVLVSAGGKTLKQSDVDKLIEFYEWAFQAQFNSNQRADYQKYTEKEFRANPAEGRKTVDDIVKTLPQILAASADIQSETRKNFLAAFLSEARNNTDANSQMLLQIYESANGGGNTSASENTASTEETTTTNNSNDSYETVKKVKVGNMSAIVGKWVSGNTGSRVLDASSGVFLGGNASRHTYEFNANGTVEYTGIMNMMAGGCRTQIFKSATGKASLNGSTLTINWAPASYSYENSCSTSKNYKKTLPAETETLQVNFETFYDDKQLCLTTKDKLCMSRD